MRSSIVLDEHGNISFFPSVEAVARYVEPIDIRNGEYIAYDSAGFLLKLVPTEPVVSISDYLSVQPHQEQLERALGSPIPAKVMSLEGLLALCVRQFGYTG